MPCAGEVFAFAAHIVKEAPSNQSKLVSMHCGSCAVVEHHSLRQEGVVIRASVNGQLMQPRRKSNKREAAGDTDEVKREVERKGRDRTRGWREENARQVCIAVDI